MAEDLSDSIVQLASGQYMSTLEGEKLIFINIKEVMEALKLPLLEETKLVIYQTYKDHWNREGYEVLLIDDGETMQTALDQRNDP